MAALWLLRDNLLWLVEFGDEKTLRLLARTKYAGRQTIIDWPFRGERHADR